VTGTLGAMPQMHVERIILGPKAPAVGQTLAETGLRSQTGALILAVRRGESDLATPSADFRLEAGDVLVVVGQPPQIKSAHRLLTGAEPV
jgi:TrkA domain protein